MSDTNFLPDKDLIEASKNFLRPQKVTDTKVWFGIVNQVSYAFPQGKLMQPFKFLVAKNQKYY